MRLRVAWRATSRSMAFVSILSVLGLLRPSKPQPSFFKSTCVHIQPKLRFAVALDLRPELGEHFRNRMPMQRIGRPDEIRGAIVWLASDASTFCTGSE